MKMSLPDESILMKWPIFSDAMLTVFREKRRDRELIDVEIVVESQKIPVHRLILQTCSKYFDSLLKNMASNSTNPPMVVLAEMKHSVVELVIDMMYNGHVDVPKTQWTQFLAAAKFLQIHGFDDILDIDPDDIIHEFTMPTRNAPSTVQPTVQLTAGPSKTRSDLDLNSDFVRGRQLRKRIERKRLVVQSDSSDSDEPIFRKLKEEEVDSLLPKLIPKISENMKCSFCGVHYSRKDHLKDHLMSDHIKDLN